MRIQILELPRSDTDDKPFAIVVSEIPIIDDDDPALASDALAVKGRWEDKLVVEGGARVALFTSEVVEIGPPEPKPEKSQAQAMVDYLQKKYATLDGYAQGGYVNGR